MTKKLIIIDDSATQLQILKTLFVNDGWDVCAVQNSKIGYEMIFDFAPDLIITDAIMPVMGGFQLIKLIRQNEKISKIPVIVYSVLNEANAKFYIKEEYSEYFLRKDSNQDKLLETANRIIQKFPLDIEYKNAILRVGLENYQIPAQQEEVEEYFEEEVQIEQEDFVEEINYFELFEEKVKKISNFLIDDEELFSSLLDALYCMYNYDLATINSYSFKEKKNKVYFDIKNIILSSILKNLILNKFDTNLFSLNKRYAPNLKSITNEEEFISKIEFNFEYKEENIADIIIYSQNELSVDELENQKVKDLLYQFFKTRHISKSSKYGKKDELINKYAPFKHFKEIKKDNEIYFGIIQINNFSDLNLNLSPQEFDILNSKVSEKIVECLEKDEQIYKSDEDEYSIVLYVSDEKQAQYKLDYILKTISSIAYNEYKINSTIVATNCILEGNFDTTEAQKKIKNYLDLLGEQEKAVII